MTFTVKHRAADGTETLYSAEKVECVRKGDRWMDGIFLDRVFQPGEPDQPAPATWQHCITFLTPEEKLLLTPNNELPKVWVMNAAGATVATYDLMS